MPFVGALIGRHCEDGRGRDEERPVNTNAFVLYNEMDNAIRRKDMEDVGFTDESVQDLERAIVDFQRYVVQMLGHFQESGFFVTNFHAYSHAAQDIRDLGICTGFDTAIFESSHPVCKAAHNETARRHGTGTLHTTQTLTSGEASRNRIEAASAASAEGKMLQELVQGHGTSLRKTPNTRLEAIESDSDALTKQGTKVSFRILSRVLQAGLPTGDCSNSMNNLSHDDKTSFKNFLLQIGDIGIACDVLQKNREIALQGLCEEPHPEDEEEESGRFRDESVIDALKVSVIRSAVVSGWSTPCLDDQFQVRIYASDDEKAPRLGAAYSEKTQVRVVDTWYRMSQRLISSHSFSHSKRTFKDSVMIEGPKSSGVVGREQGAPEVRGAISSAGNMCFGKVRGFLRITADTGLLSEKDNQEYAVVDYYDVVPGNELDKIDIATGCIKLRWATNMRDDKVMPSVHIVKVSALRARVHVVLAPQLRDSKDPELHWADETFYVSRFKHSNYEAKYNKIDIDPRCSVL